MQTWTWHFAAVCRAVPYCVEARPTDSYEKAAEIWNRRTGMMQPTIRIESNAEEVPALNEKYALNNSKTMKIINQDLRELAKTIAYEIKESFRGAIYLPTADVRSRIGSALQRVRDENVK